MDFTVIIPTRNRPELFAVALDSVLAQTARAVEVVVVNDGSDQHHEAAYSALERAGEARVRFFHLPRVPRGHGQSYALNFGGLQAQGRYLCFLDDDDCWTDAAYLSRAASSIAESGGPVDLHLSNQHAFAGDTMLRQTVWTEDLAPLLAGRSTPDAQGAFPITVPELLRSHGFCHLNTTIVRKAFFDAIGGFDENIRYECDRDFYLRAIDQATGILYSPNFVSRHNIPDPKLKASMSTAVSSFQRQLFQSYVLDKAILFGQHAQIRRHGEMHKAVALKKIAQGFAAQRLYSRAGYYAREALLVGFSFKWLAYCAWLSVRARIGGQAGAVPPAR